MLVANCKCLDQATPAFISNCERATSLCRAFTLRSTLALTSNTPPPSNQVTCYPILLRSHWMPPKPPQSPFFQTPYWLRSKKSVVHCCSTFTHIWWVAYGRPCVELTGKLQSTRYWCILTYFPVEGAACGWDPPWCGPVIGQNQYLHNVRESYGTSFASQFGQYRHGCSQQGFPPWSFITCPPPRSIFCSQEILCSLSPFWPIITSLSWFGPCTSEDCCSHRHHDEWSAWQPAILFYTTCWVYCGYARADFVSLHQPEGISHVYCHLQGVWRQ